MANVESSQVSIIAETVILDMDSSQQSELNLRWQPVRIAGTKGATRY